MEIIDANEQRVVLEQTETSHAHGSARITFEIKEPHYLDQSIELTFKERFCPKEDPNLFSSLWTSYIHQPRDGHIYLQRPKARHDLDCWIGLTREGHGAPNYAICHLPDQEEINATDHLSHTSEPVNENHCLEIENEVRSPLSFFYGMCAGNLAYLMMFRQPSRVRLAYSPNGGGRASEWSPAWDYDLHLDNAQLDQIYAWDVRLALFPFESRTKVLEEVNAFQE